uniref:hypothetical protein n=1 Tax=Cylindrospermopsis raciborskii TaxID=77022 RepID=UPI0021180700|nr:hypothetical protein [Cylindrospermopsis raciborskii]
MTTINYDYADGKTREIAEGFELKLLQKEKINEQEISWEERQLVVHSYAIAQTEEKYLRERIQKTVHDLEQLKIPKRGKKKLTSFPEWELSVAEILKRYRKRILVLLGFPPTIYTQLSGQSFTPE